MKNKSESKLGKIVIAVVVSFIVVCCFLVWAISRATNMDDVTATATDVPTVTVQVPTNTHTPPPTPTFTATVSPSATIIFPSATAARAKSPAPCVREQEPQLAKVVEVVDGDTIRVSIDGQNYSVRYIGIDTPESTKQIEPFGKEASQKNAELVFGKEVLLYRDVSETDRYGRLLRFVFVGDQFINYELVRLGYANAFRYPPDIACADFFSSAERNARDAGVGLWASQTPTPSAAQTQRVVIVSVNKVAEYVDIENRSTAPVDLSGWRLVSERGNQSCTLRGTIQPGAKLRIWAQSGDGFSCNFDKPIWNNSESDPAVLYNPQNAEVSRYP